jgi:hypothetical protein
MSLTVTPNDRPFQLTPDQIALSADRKAKKQNAKLAKSQDNHLDIPVGAIVNRAWISLPTSSLEDVNSGSGRKEQKTKVLTWNVSP